MRTVLAAALIGIPLLTASPAAAESPSSLVLTRSVAGQAPVTAKLLCDGAGSTHPRALTRRAGTARSAAVSRRSTRIPAPSARRSISRRRSPRSAPGRDGTFPGGGPSAIAASCSRSPEASSISGAPFLGWPRWNSICSPESRSPTSRRPWSGTEKLLGGAPSFFPNDREAVWELAEHRFLYIELLPAHAGHSMVTVFTGDLDTLVAGASPAGGSNRTGARPMTTASAR